MRCKSCTAHCRQVVRQCNEGIPLPTASDKEEEEEDEHLPQSHGR